jgi:CheY-like chemotaxis protein
VFPVKASIWHEVCSNCLASSEENVTTPNHAGQSSSLNDAGILIIDDDEIQCRLIKGVLEQQGFHVLTGCNPIRALETYNREREQIHLVLLDYFMPGLNGAETLQWLRNVDPNIKVILCSGADDIRLRQLMAQHTFDGYIHKPLRLQEALPAIRQVITTPTSRPASATQN